VQLKAQLPNMNPYGAVLQGAVIRGFVKQSVTDVLLGQFMRIAAQALLSDVLQQFAEPGALLEGCTGHNSLNELPTLVSSELCQRGWL